MGWLPGSSKFFHDENIQSLFWLACSFGVAWRWFCQIRDRITTTRAICEALETPVCNLNETEISEQDSSVRGSLTLLRLTTLVSYRPNFKFPQGDSNIMDRAAAQRVLSTPELVGTIFRHLWNDFGDRDKTQEAGRCCWLSLVVPGLTLSGIEELCGCSGGTDYCRLQCIVRSTERAD